jgi:hypothetical protein
MKYEEIKNRWTGKVMFGGLPLEVVIEKNKKWLRGDKEGSRAVLSGAVLSSAPFKIEKIHQKIFKAASAPGALDMSTWHCGTTHCRAGWAVTLAGDAGKALEWAYGTAAAAALIYLASDNKIGKMPYFYCDNESALADMRARAEKEAA